MKYTPPFLALCAFFAPHGTQSFAPHVNERCSSRARTSLCAATNRRDFVSTCAAAVAAASSVALSPLPSAADVSDGNALPQGAAQFSRVIKVFEQSAHTSSAVTLSPLPSAADVSDGNAPPKGPTQFSRVIKVRAELKSVAKHVPEYSTGDDMKVITKGIYDPAKKTKADEDVKLLQNLVQASQKVVSKKDAAGFGVVAAKADGLFEDFLDMLRDVPDEL
ncbi:hypothetical protein ACHAWF_006194 [Thalassiosira exigua]